MTAVSALPDEEYFGPLLQLIRYDDFDAAIEKANATSFGLSAGLLGDNEADWNHFFKRSVPVSSTGTSPSPAPPVPPLRRHRCLRQPQSERLLRRRLLCLPGRLRAEDSKAAMPDQLSPGLTF